LSKPTASPEARPLTPVELELMQHVWRLGEASVADVQAALPAERPLAYTSVSTRWRTVCAS
jgi:predicted transcriptional regulator